MKYRTALVVSAPIVAVATLMIGLRVGAGSGFRAALVYGAAPGALSPGDFRHFAFQMITYYEERGVREAIALADLTVEIRTVDGHEVHWKGSSNEDGVAEVTFELPDQTTQIAFDAREAGEHEPIAFGIIDLTKAPRRPPYVAERKELLSAIRVRPSKREGEPIDVYIESGRLVVGSPSEVWIHVGNEGRKPDENFVVHAAPELGVSFAFDDVKVACNGYAVLDATALGQAASTLLEVKGPNGEKGTWFGTLPTAPGAFWIQLDKREAVVVAPNPRKIAYVEIDDAEGRVWAAALPLVVEPGDPLPRAHVPFTSLKDGNYWLVASGDPRGAETMSGATIGKHFIVSDKLEATCDRHLDRAQHLAPPTPRWLALDGIATRGAKNRARRRLGLFIGLMALGAAALLEALLLTQASRESRLAFAAAASDEPIKTTAKTPGGNLLLAILVALLGFALLAALTVAKA